MTPAELNVIAEQERKRQSAFPRRLFCCGSTSCRMRGSQSVYDSAAASAKDRSDTDVVSTGCMSLCSRGPLVRLEEAGKPARLFTRMTPAATKAVVQSVHPLPADVEALKFPLDHPYFAQQHRLVLATLDRVDPTKIEQYLAHDGYRSLAKALHERTPESICDDVALSGLRGRGGAGYPTGVKWNLVRKATASKKYVVANGDEGDPGAFMDRTIMEDDPHRLLEGILIAAYAVGAGEAFLYVRGEVSNAVARFKRAMEDAQKVGLVGQSILGTDFHCNVQVRMGAGAFVCGEETALIASIEGGRGIPRLRPPYPSESGIHDSPTLINNVETLATIPSIVRAGPSALNRIGTTTSKGTKVFSISGPVQNAGVVEVPLGISLRTIVMEMCEGIRDGHAVKAIQCGGASGGCVPADSLDLAVDYESMSNFGVIMGSGGMIVVDDRTDIVSLAKFFMGFSRDESCGKCVPCRVGTVQMSRLLERIDRGAGTAEDLARLEDLCDLVQQTSLCGLGQAAPNPVLSTLKHFRAEYLGKIGDRRLGFVELSSLADSARDSSPGNRSAEAKP